ncbi:MAG TPA: TonB-dependent receptor, partial [Longimicrobium sp.]|nr:TonB-dependent receptor [Longimicrobium sp.]
MSGRVVESGSGRPVAGAIVRAIGTGAAVETDLDGSFRLRVALPQTLRVSHLGFGVRDTTLQAPDETGAALVIALSAAPLRLAGITVEVSDERPVPTPHYELSPVGISRVPPLAEPDIFRAINTLPGIDQPNGWRSAFHVRGGASDEVLVLLDGIPLTEPFHMLGLFSGVQLGVVEGATVHLGAPPVHFDDRLSGIIDIRTTVPDSTFYRGHASLLSGGAITGRRWSSGSLLMGARYATTQLIGAAMDLGSYGFADANLRLRQDISPGLSLDASGFWNGDWITDVYGSEAPAGGQISYRPDYHWGNRAGRLGLIRQNASGWRTRADAVYSDYRIDFRDVPRQGGAAPVQIVDARSTLIKAGVSVEGLLGTRHRVTFGGELQRERFDHHSRGALEEFSENVPPTYDYDAVQNRGAVYVADVWTPAASLDLSVGVRALFLPDAEQGGPHLAPRLGFTWQA